jgi:nicotinate phosphoribosyltransferase
MIKSHFNGANADIFTDLYELTMAQAYLEAGHTAEAGFDLFARELPPGRNYLIACGQSDAVDFLSELRFSDGDLEYLESLGKFSRTLLDWLADFRFTGEVRAVPEGTVVFQEEPILSVRAPIAQAQVIETWLLNQVHVQTVLASKASRFVNAAGGRPVLDFGLRRIHGADAGLKSAKAYHVAGLTATSNMLAGKLYGVPVAGTMAHSFVQSFDDELDAFRQFARSFPETIILVDTYDSLEGIRRLLRLRDELGDEFRVTGIRLDSGDLERLARDARELLDDAGLEHVKIFASGGLDEYQIRDLVSSDAPIDGFGVGTSMGVSSDAPHLDVAYKLCSYDGDPRMKLSTGKRSLPGFKQVFRQSAGDRYERDIIARDDETLEGEPLLETVMKDGERLGGMDLQAARERAAADLARLPERLRQLEQCDERYPVELSEGLQADLERLSARLGADA